MRTQFFILLIATALTAGSCGSNTKPDETSTADPIPGIGGQEAVKDDESQKDIVKVAVGSTDHSTLVTALKKAELVTSLSNSGPFTVFAPTNAAFDKLPPGTLEGLMEEGKKTDLQNILQYHVTTSALKTEYLADGMNLGMVNGDKIAISVKDGKVILNGSATIIASVPASNGIIHIVDAVLLPPSKK